MYKPLSVRQGIKQNPTKRNSSLCCIYTQVQVYIQLRYLLYNM